MSTKMLNSVVLSVSNLFGTTSWCGVIPSDFLYDPGNMSNRMHMPCQVSHELYNPLIYDD